MADLMDVAGEVFEKASKQAELGKWDAADTSLRTAQAVLLFDIATSLRKLAKR